MNNMKFLTVGLLALLSETASAQQFLEGTSYYLPQTVVRYHVLVERTSTQPGDYCMYAERFLKKKNVATQRSTTYRIVDISTEFAGERDTSKLYTATIDSKHSIESLMVNEQGVLTAVNTQPKAVEPREKFQAAPKPVLPNPHDYMNQEILAAGSSAKTAELAAQEIYDIRDSRSQLSKGQADFMPKDGEQLRLMLQNLDTQEQALLQLFEGITERDTTETIITFVPRQEVRKHVLFRFSKKLGLVDSDDLAGTPYYINVEDMHAMPTNTAVADESKKSKDDANIYVTMPGKIRLTLQRAEQDLLVQDVYAGQFGKSAPLDNELFGKKLFTKLIVNPVNGNVESIETEMVKK